MWIQTHPHLAVGAVGGGVIPDLRYSPILASSEAWQQIVIGGVLSSRGMIGFSAELSPDDAEAARKFVIQRNRFAHSSGETKRMSR